MTRYQPALIGKNDVDIIAAIKKHRGDVHTRQMNWSCAELATRLRNDYIYVPEYQRPFVWSDTMQSRFIESLILRLPIPYVFYSEMSDGRLEVVDGSQRLRTVAAFLDDNLRLCNLEKIPKLNGLYFSDLPDSERNFFQNNSVDGFVFTAVTNEETRFDIFRRINSFGVQLSDAQNRAGSLKGPFYDIVLECAKEADFVNLCTMSKSKDPVGDRAERVVRFFAYGERYMDFRHDVKEFLDKFVDDKNNDPKLDAAAYRAKFSAMIAYVRDFFPYGFYRSKTSTEVPRVRFEAISVGVQLALQSDRLNPIPSFDWLDGEEFRTHCRTDASNSSTRLRGRVEYVRDRLVY